MTKVRRSGRYRFRIIGIVSDFGFGISDFDSSPKAPVGLDFQGHRNAIEHQQGIRRGGSHRLKDDALSAGGTGTGFADEVDGRLELDLTGGTAE
jgi:hypothetical protein